MNILYAHAVMSTVALLCTVFVNRGDDHLLVVM